MNQLPTPAALATEYARLITENFDAEDVARIGLGYEPQQDDPLTGECMQDALINLGVDTGADDYEETPEIESLMDAANALALPILHPPTVRAVVEQLPSTEWLCLTDWLTLIDPAVLDCPTDSAVGEDSRAVLIAAANLLHALRDISTAERLAIMRAAAHQLHVFYFG